jgi:hypothetical protein
MNFYIEPSGGDEVTLHTLFYSNFAASFGGSTISYLDNTITVTFCYLYSSGQSETFDPQTHIINLPNGYNSYTLNIELYSDGDNIMPCTLEILEETRTFTFDYPYDNSATTFIPDNEFENYLEDLGFGDDIAYNDLVFTNRIENMTILDFNYIVFEDVFSMEGIKAFKELKTLRCHSQQISSLDTSQNLKLEQLWCMENPITELDLTNNVNLNWLWAGYMNLTELDVSQNINLEKLTVYHNNINAIDVSQNVNLKEFSIFNNNMENIDISNNILLEKFWGGNTLITSLNTSNNINLKELYLGNSFITEIDLTNNTLLERLDFHESLLTGLDTSTLINLKVLVGYDNQLTTLDLSNNYLLEAAILHNNNLISLNVKNGNNENIETFVTVNNYGLFCIEVDAPAQNGYPGWNVDDQVVFSEDCSLGMDDVLATQIMLYPNPVQHVLNIENSSNYHINSFKVYDVMGRMVFNLNHPNHPLDVSSLETGLFFVSINTVQGTLIKKFIKE